MDNGLHQLQGQRASGLLVGSSRRRLLVDQGSLEKAHPREATL